MLHWPRVTLSWLTIASVLADRLFPTHTMSFKSLYKAKSFVL
jgi:hypothetical protein